MSDNPFVYNLNHKLYISKSVFECLIIKDTYNEIFLVLLGVSSCLDWLWLELNFWHEYFNFWVENVILKKFKKMQKFTIF